MTVEDYIKQKRKLREDQRKLKDKLEKCRIDEELLDIQFNHSPAPIPLELSKKPPNIQYLEDNFDNLQHLQIETLKKADQINTNEFCALTCCTRKDALELHRSGKVKKGRKSKGGDFWYDTVSAVEYDRFGGSVLNAETEAE